MPQGQKSNKKTKMWKLEFEWTTLLKRAQTHHSAIIKLED